MINQLFMRERKCARDVCEWVFYFASSLSAPLAVLALMDETTVLMCTDQSISFHCRSSHVLYTGSAEERGKERQSKFHTVAHCADVSC